MVQDRGSPCSDSVYQVINVSTVQAGWMTMKEDGSMLTQKVCVNNKIIFDPYVTLTTSGITSISGSSLWTDQSTNPIPKMVTVLGSGMSTFLGFTDFLWMQPNGTKAAIPPVPAARSQIRYMRWNFGNGVIQQLTLSGVTWIPLNGVIAPGVTITGPSSLTGNNNLPRVNYSYPIAGPFRPSLTVINQFGCSDSLQRNVLIVQELPKAVGTGGSVCVNNALITVTGTITGTTAGGGIWSGGTGSYFSSATLAGTYLSMIYTLGASEQIPGNTVNLSLTTYNNGVCPAGVTTSIGINVLTSPYVEAGPPATVCGNNMIYILSGVVTGTGSGGAFSAYWQTKGTGDIRDFRDSNHYFTR